MRTLLILVAGFSLVAAGCSKDVGAADKPVTFAPEQPKLDPAKVAAEPAGKDAAGGQWVTIKGKIIWDTSKAAAPKREEEVATKDQEVCAKDKDFIKESWVVNAKNNGIKNVVVWVVPEPTGADLTAVETAKKDNKSFVFKSFKESDIHPKMVKPEKDTVEIDQPCCRFIPHVLVARAGQNMLIKNSAPVPHNAKWTSRNNGEINPLIPPGGEYKLEKPLEAERFPIAVECSIHPWMKAWVRVFDHPYVAVTDDDGNFEIKNAPVMGGKLRMFIWQENGMHGGNAGRFGQTIEVKAGTLDLKEIKFDSGK
jgi:hypothetical protein